MADNRVGIHLYMTGEESIDELYHKLLELENKKIHLRMATDSNIAKIDNAIKRITSRRNEVNLSYTKTLSKLNKELDAITNKQRSINLDYSKIEKAQRAMQLLSARQEQVAQKLVNPAKSSTYRKMGAGIDKLQNYVNRLQGQFKGKYGVFGDLGGYQKLIGSYIAQQKGLQQSIKLTKSAMASATSGYDKRIGSLKTLKSNLKQELTLDTKSINNAMALIRNRIKAQKLEAKVDLKADFGEFFSRTQSYISRLGSTMMTLGRGIQRLTSPVDSIIRGLTYGVGYRAVGKFVEGISGAFERYDIFKTYEKQLSALGFDANKKFSIGTDRARTAVENLNEAVLGLPTGLDAIVKSQKRYLAATGDMEKATKIAIAANNAFLADKADEREQRFVEKQLRNLLATGKLTDMQWTSLWKNAPLAMQSIAKEMGYGIKGVGKMIGELKSGKKDVDSFFDAFIRTGVSGELAESANAMKHTWEGVSQNINNAFRRMGDNIIKTTDETLGKALGKDSIDIAIEFKNTIDDISESIQGWIKANPDKIIDFLDKIRSYDWKGLMSGLAQGFGGVIQFIGKLLDMSIGTDNGENVGKALVKWNMIGKGLTVLGGAIKGLSFPIAGWITFTKFLPAISTALKTSAGANMARNAGRTIAGLKGAGKVADVAKPAITKWGALAKFGTAAQVLAGGYAIKAILEGIKEVADVKFSGDIVKTMTAATVALTAVTGVVEGIGYLISKSKEAALGVGVAAGATWLVGDTVSKVLSSIKDLADGLKVLYELKPLKKTKFHEVAQSILDVSGDLAKIYEALDKTFPKTRPANFAEAAQGKTSIAKTTKEMLQALKNLREIESVVKQIANEKPLSKKKVENAVNNILALKEIMPRIKEALREVFKNDRGEGADPRSTTPTGFSSQEFKAYSEITGHYRKIFENITGIFTNMKDMLKTVAKLTESKWFGGKGEFNFDTITAQFDKLSTLFDALKPAVEKASTYRNVDKSVKGYNNLASIFKAVHDVALSLEGVDMASDVEKLNNAIAEINKIEGLKGGSIFGNGLNGNTGGTRMPGLNGGAVTVPFTAIPKITWKKINKKQIMATLGSALSSVSVPLSFTFKAIFGNVGEVENAVRTEIWYIKNRITNLDAKTTKKVMVNFIANTSGVGKVISQVVNMFSTIRRRLRELNGNFNKDININLKTNIRRSGEKVTGGTLMQHTGGLVTTKGRPLYRAVGGGVPGHAKGTDTVPAWLTPGEYVNRRWVVNKLGVAFFQKLNHMDLHGALKELSIRAGSHLNGGTTINNYNNTTNNITMPWVDGNSSQNFALRRVGRFAGAL